MVLGKLFRRLFLPRLIQLHDAALLAVFGSLAHRAEACVPATFGAMTVSFVSDSEGHEIELLPIAAAA